MYEIQVNRTWVQPANEQHWGLDVFEGRHIIPSGRDLTADNTWGPGVNSLPGPPKSSFFKLEFWVAGDGDSALLEARIRECLGFFRQKWHRNNIDFVWNDSSQLWYYQCPARITSTDVFYGQGTSNARIKMVLENLQGFWRDSQPETKRSTNFAGAPQVVNSGDAAIYDATLEITGPCTNPVFAITREAQEDVQRYLKYKGTINAGQKLRIICSPIICTLNGTSVVQNLDWYGSEGRALDLMPGDWLNCKATGVNAANGSEWNVGYKNVRY